MDDVFINTDTPECPWIWVDSNNKQKARIAVMQYLLLNNDYLGKDLKAIGKIDEDVLHEIAL